MVVTYWDVLSSINFIVVAIGIMVNLLYFKLVVCNCAFDGYCRITSLIINSGTTATLLSNLVTCIVCLTYGSYTDSGLCENTFIVILMRYVHAYGEWSIASGKFLLVFERFSSIFLPKFRSAVRYPHWFSLILVFHTIGLITYVYLIVTLRSIQTILFCITLLSLLIIASVVLVIYLLCSAKEKYYETLGKLPLNSRFLLSESYELCRSSLYPLVSSLALSVSYCISTWLMLLGLVFQDLFYEYFVFGNIIMNINCTIFPLIFLLSNRKVWKKIVLIFPKLNKISPTGTPKNYEVHNLSGTRIDFVQSQAEYFSQLKNTWG